MGMVSLPAGVTFNDYENWLNTPAGQAYIRPIENWAQSQGIRHGVSHMPPADQIRAWMNSQSPAQPPQMPPPPAGMPRPSRPERPGFGTVRPTTFRPVAPTPSFAPTPGPTGAPRPRPIPAGTPGMGYAPAPSRPTGGGARPPSVSVPRSGRAYSRY